MEIKENYSLKDLNTFGIDVQARYFVEVSSDQEIKSFLSDYNSKLKDKPILILSGGSNILFTKDYNGIVLKINTKGIEIVKENRRYAYIKAKAGEVWDDLVKYCINNNFGGIENLTFIPGRVGAAPIQNIGAYGVKLKNSFYKLNAINIKTRKEKKFLKKDCDFGYRRSIFTGKAKNQYIILSVTLKLNKKSQFDIQYDDVKNELNKIGAQQLDIKVISEAVCRVRTAKLPDPDQIGNAGSFFKNPLISTSQYKKLAIAYPSIKAFELSPVEYKLYAGWLIEHCGWKGKKIGNAGVHRDNALILVNYGGAKGSDIFELSKQIQKSVFDKFEVKLEPEVNII